ncbi:NAD(P)H-dependent D-xylose reductase (XR) [Hypoxylon texense]
MRYSSLTLTLASLLALASSVATRQRSTKDLEPPTPWQVTRLTTGQPSGRPGSNPLAHVFANITNPSPIPAGPGAAPFAASSANCSVDWAFGTAQPYGGVHECTTVPTAAAEDRSPASASSSKWTIEILETDPSLYAPTEKLDVRFTLTLTSSLTVDGSAYSKVLVATQHFEVGDNMRGICGGSGVCAWDLKEELIPLLIQPTIVACEGTC